MSRPAPPALTVRYEGSTRTFAAGSDVVVGRDLRADLRIAHPLISRAHVVLRFDQGRWVAIDNGSLNGMFVNGRRVPAVDIQDGQQINIGNPDGPGLTFEVGQAPGRGRDDAADDGGAAGGAAKRLMADRGAAAADRATAGSSARRISVRAAGPQRPAAGYASGPQQRYPSGPPSRGAYPPSTAQPVRAGSGSDIRSPPSNRSPRWARRPRPARARGTSRRAC